MKLEETFLPAATKALFDTNLVSSRMILAMAEFIWAILLIWPGNTMDRPTYKIMALCFPESVWAVLFLIMGACQAAIVIREDFHSLFSRVFASLNALFWSFVVISMLLSVRPPPAAIGGEIALAMAAVWIFIRPYIVFKGIVRARSNHI